MGFVEVDGGLVGVGLTMVGGGVESLVDDIEELSGGSGGRGARGVGE